MRYIPPTAGDNCFCFLAHQFSGLEEKASLCEETKCSFGALKRTDEHERIRIPNGRVLEIPVLKKYSSFYNQIEVIDRICDQPRSCTRI